jgi:hypothetical protein
MSADPTPHVSADELDALHDRGAPSRVTSHIATCGECRNLVALDTRLVSLLASLPQWEPSPTFTSRVLGQLTPPKRPAPAAAGVPTDRSVAARRRVVVAGWVTGGAVAAGFAWAALNPAAAHGLAGPALGEVSRTLWLSLQGVVANTMEQPWFGAVRDTMASPLRTVPFLLGAGAAYVAALVWFRRLLTSPATDAGW